jgi:hypothetical protein
MLRLGDIAALTRVVTRTYSDGRTDDRTMAVGAFVTWTHCSVLFEVTWGKTSASAQTHGRVRADVSASARTVVRLLHDGYSP